MVLIELQKAIRLLLAERLYGPALLQMYSFIDICASLVRPDTIKKNDTQQIFINYLRVYSSFKWERYSPLDLWAARSSLLHAYSPFGHHTERGKARPIFYCSSKQEHVEMERILAQAGQREYFVVDVNEIHVLTYDSFNAMLFRLERDVELEKVFITNGRDILSDVQQVRLREALERIGESIAAAKARGQRVRVRSVLAVREPRLARAMAVRDLQLIRALVISGMRDDAWKGIARVKSYAECVESLGPLGSSASDVESAKLLQRAMAIAEKWLRSRAGFPAQ